MGSPVATSESHLQVKSISLEKGMLGGTASTLNSIGRMRFNLPIQDNFGGLPYFAQTMPHQSVGSPAWPVNQLLSDSQAICANSTEYHDNIQSSVVLSKNKSSGTSDEDESSWRQATGENQCEKGKPTSPWQRIKWTNDMIKFLIDIVNYVGEDGICENLDINKRSILQKKGKWRTVSNVMNNKGWYVSPQQCEDKFNDLNKRYKRLTDILGRDIALQVVDNVCLLDNMQNLSTKRKEDVKKILSSKHSFHKEMHLYHIGIRSPMVRDRWTHSGKSLDETGMGSTRSAMMHNVSIPYSEVRVDMESSSLDLSHANKSMDGIAAKREPSLPESSSKCPHGVKEASIELDAAGTMQGESNSEQELVAWRQRLIHLEELKVGLQAQAVELAAHRHRWHKLNSKKNDKLEMLRAENKRLKLENGQLSHQLKQKELEVECKRSVTSMALFDLVLEKLRAQEQLQYVQGK